MELNAIDLRDADEVQRSVAAFARDPDGGLIVTASGFSTNHSHMLADVAVRNNLPAVYPFRYFVEAGGLMSYGPELVEPYRRAAGYVDRILKGEKPADLPVQAQQGTKFEWMINLKTARMLDLSVAPTLLARADEVIE
jgi:putative ABC transport system substrate-binding protein